MATTIRTVRDVRRFPGLPESIGQARAWVAGLLPAGCPRADDVALVVSELATNAVLHSASGAPGGVFEIRVDVEPGVVAVAVADAGPALVPASRQGEFGRGLVLVATLADAYEAIAGEAGRTAWCRLDWSTPEAVDR
jgi:anti-sigma regulatory factor (Ser/Thr protein kinase)